MSPVPVAERSEFHANQRVQAQNPERFRIFRTQSHPAPARHSPGARCSPAKMTWTASRTFARSVKEHIDARDVPIAEDPPSREPPWSRRDRLDDKQIHVLRESARAD